MINIVAVLPCCGIIIAECGINWYFNWFNYFNSYRNPA